MTEKILFICGSLNQTKMMHKIAQHMGDYECYFTPYYADGIERKAAQVGLLNATVLGGRHQQDTLNYIKEHQLNMDWRGKSHNYDLVVTCSDLLIQKNIRGKRMVLVQEGITEPETWIYHLVKWLKLPRYLANTAATGLSDAYDIFCVASPGYRDHFIKKGVKADKVVVTGIPNFDHFSKLYQNEFPLKGYVLVATSSLRESLRYDNRKAFLQECDRIANGRPLIFKLHPMEDEKRARKEINRYAPESFVLTEGDVDAMIANADEVITQQSTCTFTALALDKKVHSYLDLDELKRLLPIQNNGTSAKRIAKICDQVLHTPLPVLRNIRAGFRSRPKWENIE